MESQVVPFRKQSALTRFEETQIKCQLGAGTIILQLIEHFLIINRS